MNWNGITILLQRDIQDVARDLLQSNENRPMFSTINAGAISLKLQELQGIRGVYYNRCMLLHDINQHSAKILLPDIESLMR